MMTRLLSITLLLFILLFAGCNKNSVITEGAVPITFSGAFELVETKNGAILGDALPEIKAQVVGSLSANDFFTIYTPVENLVTGVNLDQQVTFIEGEGILSHIVHYPSDNAPVYVKAYAPSRGVRNIERAPNEVVFENLTGHEDVMLTKPNTEGESGVGRGTNEDGKRDITLTFMHKLSKISFKFVAEAGEDNGASAEAEWGNITDVKLIGYPNNITLYLDKTTGDYLVDESKTSDITILDSNSDLAQPVVLPADGAVPTPISILVPPCSAEEGRDWKLSITSEKNGTRVLSSKFKFESGNHHVFTITLLGNKELAFDAKLANWSTEDVNNSGNSNIGDL